MPAGGTQAQDGPGPGLPSGGGLGEAGGENSLTADTGLARAADTRRQLHLPAVLPTPSPLTGQAQPHSQETGGWTRWHRDGGLGGTGRLGG